MAAYRRVDTYITHAARLPAHRECPGSAPGPTVGNEYGKPVPFLDKTEDVKLTEAAV